MDDLSRDHRPSAVFRSPRLDRLFVVILAVTLTPPLCVIVFALLAGIGMALVGASSGPPVSWLLTSVIVSVVAAILTVRTISRAHPTRLALTPHHVEIGGRVFKRWIPYGDIRLVQIEQIRYVIGSATGVAIRTEKGRARRIALHKHDTIEAFETLHYLSDAGGIGPGEELYAPVDPAHHGRAVADIARDYRRKARWAWIVAAGALLYSAMAATAIALGTPSNSTQHIRAWSQMLIGAVTGIGALIAAVRFGRAARFVEARGEDVFAPPVLDDAQELPIEESDDQAVDIS